MYYHRSNLSMRFFLYIVKVVFIEPRRISLIRQFLSSGTTNQFVCSFLPTRLGSSLLTRLPSNLWSKLQRIQNYKPHLVSNTWKPEQESSVHKFLHWLLVESGIKSKVANIIYQCHGDSAFHSYLIDFVDEYEYHPTTTLR